MEKNKVIKVVFYEVEILGKTCREAIVFREDGMHYEDIEAGIDALHELAKQNGIKSIDELKQTNCYSVLSEKMFEKEFPSIYGIIKRAKNNANKNTSDNNENSKQQTKMNSKVKTNNSEDNKNTSEGTKKEEKKESDSKSDTKSKKKKKEKKKSLKEILSKFSIKKFFLRNKFYALATLVGLTGGFVIGNKLINKNNDVDINTNTVEDTNDKTNDIPDNSITESVETTDEMLDKYGSVSYILEKSDINTTKKNTTKKIWSYLNNYNINISQNNMSKNTDTKLAHTWDETVVSYFAYNNLTKEELSKVFDNYYVYHETFEEAYEKGVEQDILAYTVLTESTNKSNLINSSEGKDFYNKYENLMIKYNKNYNTVDSESIANELYKEIRQDFDINKDIKDSESYKLSVVPIIQALNDVTEDRDFENKLTDKEMAYFDKLSQYEAIKDKISDISSTLNPYVAASEALNDNTEEFTYSQIKAAAIAELERKNAYFTSETDRNITDHENYEEKFDIKDDQVVEDNNNNNENDYNVDDAGMVEDEEEDKIPDWMLEEEEQDDYEEEIDTKDEDEIVDEEVIEVEEDTPDVPEVEDDTEENTDDTIKDITPDDDGVDYEDELPDPNKENSVQVQSQNEVIADMIINQMATNPSNVSQKGKTYVK